MKELIFAAIIALIVWLFVDSIELAIALGVIAWIIINDDGDVGPKDEILLVKVLKRWR